MNKEELKTITKTLHVNIPTPIFRVIQKGIDLKANRIDSIVTNMLSNYYGIKVFLEVI